MVNKENCGFDNTQSLIKGGVEVSKMISMLCFVEDVGFGPSYQDTEFICLAKGFQFGGNSFYQEGDVGSSKPSIRIIVSCIQVFTCS